ncbi:MAG: hypothetical protein IJ341_02735 [Bacteroidales bacterium]|nr:hypothetical protein [Bacteroidales bacterium]
MSNVTSANFSTIPNELLRNINEISVRRLIIEEFGNPSNAFAAVNRSGEDVLVSVNAKTGLTIRAFKNDGTIYAKYYDKNGVFIEEGAGGYWK